MSKKLLMGNEAFAHAALEAGVRVVAGYPGTPSSELIETVARLHAKGSAKEVHVEWSTNEKAALEVAAAASMAGARALFTCKQVGLNVASDALMSLNYVGVQGGLVVFVADDPGPISSQTEQDTRRFAAFAKVPVLDPATPEQGFEMMKIAFELSETYHTPVIVRPTTRIDHASTFFEVADSTTARPLPSQGFRRDPDKWVIFPSRAFEGHGQINKRLSAMAHDFSYDPLYAQFNGSSENGQPMEAIDVAHGSEVSAGGKGEATLGIICGGVSTQYALEALEFIRCEAARAGLEVPPYRFMQIGTPYPFPRRSVGRFLKNLSDVLVLEELDSVIEEELMKVASTSFLSPNIHGKLTAEANERGENSTEDAAERISAFFDAYRKQPQRSDHPTPLISLHALVKNSIGPAALLSYGGTLPPRPPVLCAGCPHRGSFYAVKNALARCKIDREDAIFCGDIGCYTLGNADPLDAVDTCLCMGAGITMAQGFAITQPGRKCIAFAGDSTFFASGMTGIANAVYNNHDITICVLDNATTAMTGSQPHPGTGTTLMGQKSEPIQIPSILEAMGVKHIFEADPLVREAAEEVCVQALEIPGPSAVIFKSPCVWTVPFGIPAKVSTSRCTGCKKCITEIGCPAIGFDPEARGAKSGRRGQAFVDRSQCNGCKLCLQVCPFDALSIAKDAEPAVRQSRLNRGGAPIRTRREAAGSPPGAPMDGVSIRLDGAIGAPPHASRRGQEDIGETLPPYEDVLEPEEPGYAPSSALYQEQEFTGGSARRMDAERMPGPYAAYESQRPYARAMASSDEAEMELRHYSMKEPSTEVASNAQWVGEEEDTRQIPSAETEGWDDPYNEEDVAARSPYPAQASVANDGLKQTDARMPRMQAEGVSSEGAPGVQREGKGALDKQQVERNLDEDILSAFGGDVFLEISND